MGELKRSARNIKWIEQYCRVPEGMHVGQRLKLRPFQKNLLRKIYDNPHGTRQAIVSFGRKNAKTTLAACLLLLHLTGPEARPNSRLNSAAQSRNQAALLFDLAAKMVRMSPDLNDVVLVRDSTKQLFCQELGTLYQALSAEAKTAYGLSPVFVVHDELGQVKGPRSELYEALETAMGAHRNPLSIVISTQAPTDADLLSVLIDDAVEGNDPRVVVALYAADLEISPFTVKAIRQANPAYGYFLSADEVKGQAAAAKRMPSRQAAYLNLVLNQRVERASPFIPHGVWMESSGPVADFSGLPVWGGLDLGEASNDLTALVWVAPKDGVWQVRPTFWLPEDALWEKARADGAPYDLWRQQGYLETTPGKTIEYGYLAAHLIKACNEMDVRKIAYDRWNFNQFKRALREAGFSEWQLEGDGALFEMFGQGYKSMSPAVRTLESDLLNEKVAHGGHPLLAWCNKNTKVLTDPAGNRKPVKRHETDRIDGIVALLMARSVAEHAAPEPEESIYNQRGLLVI